MICLHVYFGMCHLKFHPQPGPIQSPSDLSQRLNMLMVQDISDGLPVDHTAPTHFILYILKDVLGALGFVTLHP